MEALISVLSDVNQTVVWSNDCLLVADIVKVSQHMQSGHPDKLFGRIP